MRRLCMGWRIIARSLWLQQSLLRYMPGGIQIADPTLWHRRCPMDPQTIATTALTVLSPYLAKAGEKAVEEVGKKLPDQVGHMWRAITAKFTGKPAAEEAVK